MRGSVVDEVAERVAFDIVSGRLAAGERLPSIRRLAEEHAINPATVQLVLGRLRTAGFVETRQGLGAVVRDVETDGGVETWRYLFRLSTGVPDLTARILADLLETLRMFYESALGKIARSPGAYDPAPVRRAVQRLDLLVRTGTPAPADVHHGVLQVLRAASAALGGGVFLGVLNSLGPMFGDVPAVLDAVYADPGAHVWWWDTLVTAWESGDLDTARAALTLLEDFEAQVIDRLHAILAAGTP
ncbi:GntR family transcriptional regulator [Actinomadura flavalba]|uniref:GntR family transcriptional regulator n=1 Tax=Actinomadura flavalba TaxID=1120938 RepID=UPI00035FC3E5|nr:GntR family transcriptional regulator [Actinomadura flavalba]